MMRWLVVLALAVALGAPTPADAALPGQLDYQAGEAQDHFGLQVAQPIIGGAYSSTLAHSCRVARGRRSARCTLVADVYRGWGDLSSDRGVDHRGRCTVRVKVERRRWYYLTGWQCETDELRRNR
jgi:hypothetical protein